MTAIDWTPTLFDEMTEDQAPNPDRLVERVVTDTRRGHLVLHGVDGRDVAFVDLGPVLQVGGWGGQGCELEPRHARDLADALRWWADRKTAA